MDLRHLLFFGVAVIPICVLMRNNQVSRAMRILSRASLWHHHYQDQRNLAKTAYRCFSILPSRNCLVKREIYLIRFIRISILYLCHCRAKRLEIIVFVWSIRILRSANRVSLLHAGFPQAQMIWNAVKSSRFQSPWPVVFGFVPSNSFNSALIEQAGNIADLPLLSV